MGKIEFLHHDYEEHDVACLPDTGADIDMVTEELITKLEQLQLVQRVPLRTPLYIGSVKDKIALTITHSVSLTIRVGENLFTHTFAIAPIPAPPHIILGKPWMKHHCPEVLYQLELIGASKLSTDSLAKVVLTREETQTNPCLEEQKPTPLSPSTDPAAAFSAGGVFSAIEAETHRRKELHNKYITVMRAQIHVEDALTQHKLDAGTRGLTGNQPNWLETIPTPFRKYANTVFSDEAAAKLPPHRPGYDCDITLKEGEHLRTSKIYDMSQEQLTTLKQLLDKELAKGFIRSSTSDSSAPVFFVRDPPSESRNQGQLRLVVDYRDLNQKIELNEFPIPLSRTIMSRLPRAKIFTKFDVRSGFSNLRMKEGSEGKTAFKTFFGLFEYQVMPMGLATAPSVFQRFINSVLSPFLEVFCFAYLDDIIIFSNSEHEHQQHVEKILQALEKNSLCLKPSKCEWFTRQISFLGYTAIAEKGIRMADDKLQGLRDIKPPTCLSELRSFLGMINFYDKFIPHYSDRVSCLTSLTRKDALWEWNPTTQRAFDQLLTALREDVFLAGFDPDLPITLETDASDAAYAGVISQPNQHGKLQPVIFFHHKFKDAEKNWDAADKELYAIVFAFQHYRHFLAAPRHPVKVFSDHRNLSKFMFTTNLLKSHDGRLGRWWEILSGSNFLIEYRTGATNQVADFLSRYGYEDSTDLEHHQLLPATRFSQKSLTDISEWFKNTPRELNIRAKLETSFGKNQKGSPIPVSESAPSKTLRLKPDALIHQSTLRSPSVEGRTGKALRTYHQEPRLGPFVAADHLQGYSGTPLDSILPLEPRLKGCMHGIGYDPCHEKKTEETG
jgi:hypothetical protein